MSIIISSGEQSSSFCFVRSCRIYICCWKRVRERREFAKTRKKNEKEEGEGTLEKLGRNRIVHVTPEREEGEKRQITSVFEFYKSSRVNSLDVIDGFVRTRIIIILSTL